MSWKIIVTPCLLGVTEYKLLFHWKVNSSVACIGSFIVYKNMKPVLFMNDHLNPFVLLNLVVVKLEI